MNDATTIMLAYMTGALSYDEFQRLFSKFEPSDIDWRTLSAVLRND